MKDYLLINPRTDCSELFDESQVSFIPMPNVQEKNNCVQYDLVKYEAVKKGFTVFQKGDLIWAKITPCMQNGKSCVVSEMPTEIGFGSTEFHVIRKRTDEIYMPFIWAIFSNDDVLKAAQAVFSGSAGQQRVAASFLERFPAVLPKYEKQVEMVKNLEEKLQELNHKRQDADRLLYEIDELVRKAIGIGEETYKKPMIYAVTGINAKKSRFDTEYHNPFYTHRVDRIKEVNHDTLENIIEISTETWNQRDFFSDTFPYIEISGVGIKNNNYQVTPTTVASAPSRAKMIVRNQDIIVSTTRPHRGAIATIVCSPQEVQIASTGFCVLRELLRTDVLREYLQWILLNDYVLLQMLQRSSGGNYPAITAEEIRKIVIPIPSLEIQERICKEAKERKALASKLHLEAENKWTLAKFQFENKLLEGGVQ